MAIPLDRGKSRVWTIEDRAGPANTPIYQKNMKAASPTKNFGDVTRIEGPDPNRYGSFMTIGETRGADERATMDIMGRYAVKELSELLRLAEKRCKVDVQVHMGDCQNPAVFNSGWDKVLVLEDGVLTTWSTPDELGALESGEQGVVNEQTTVSADKVYEIKKLAFEEQGAAQVAGEVLNIVVCDEISCGACGVPSDGCQKVFAISSSSASSPSGVNDLLYTDDGGTTWTATPIDLWPAASEPTGLACVGDNIVVISNVACALAYAPIDDILLGTETWTQVTTGLTCAAGAPNAICALNANEVWIVGNGGYIYFSSDPTASVTAQDAGVATTENLNDVHGFDSENVVAVGNNNAVVRTTDGGDTWTAVTGPAVGVNLNAVFMRSADEWFVGTAAGNLYYTRDAGVSWTTKTFPGSGAGVVRDIQFTPGKPSVGYLAHNTAAPVGRILRTIDGGNSWYILPESGKGNLPDNDRINELAICNQNVVYGAGLGANGSDGIIVKGA